MRLTIVVPAYNEEHRIRRMLDAYLPFFAEKYGADAEVLVVVNGSTDATEAVVRSYQPGFPSLRCIVETDRIGKGGALMLGFREARGALVGFVDADGSTPPEAFQDLVESIGPAGAIIASRWCPGAHVSPRQPLDRRIASRIFNRLIRLLFGLRITDTQCGAKLMRAEAVRAVLPELGITRWAFDVDLLFQLHRHGFEIREIPTTWRDVAGSKLNVARTSLEMFAAIVRLRIVHSPLSWLIRVYDRTVGPVLHPQGVEQDYLLRHSLLLMSAAQVGNVANLAFQLAMVRMLSTADYSVMAAMLGLYTGASLPLGAVDRTAAHYTALFLARGERDHVRALVRRLLRDVTVGALALLAVALAGLGPLQAYFNVDSPLPLLLALAALALSIYRPVLTGVLGGAQAFMWCSAVAVAWAVVRLVAGIAAVSAVGGADAALAANAVAVAASVALSAVGLHKVLGPGARSRDPVRGVYHYFTQYVIASAAFAVMMYGDVVMARHYFTPDAAGGFAKAAMVARVAIFLPMPVAGALFPKVVSSGETSYASWLTLVKALALVAALAVAAAATCSVAPALLLRLLADTSAPELAPVLVLLAWALAPLSIALVIMSYELAQRRFAVVAPMVLSAVGYLAGVRFWHATSIELVLVLLVTSLFAMLAAAACLPWRSLRGGGSGQLASASAKPSASVA